MKGNRIRSARLWGGVGLIVLGMTIGVLTFISVIGPVLGLILVVMGIGVIGWTLRPREFRARNRRSSGL